MDLARDPRLRVSEVLIPLRAQLDDPRTRPAAWAYLRDHFEALRKRLDFLACTKPEETFVLSVFLACLTEKRVPRPFHGVIQDGP